MPPPHCVLPVVLAFGRLCDCAASPSARHTYAWRMSISYRSILYIHTQFRLSWSIAEQGLLRDDASLSYVAPLALPFYRAVPSPRLYRRAADNGAATCRTLLHSCYAPSASLPTLLLFSHLGPPPWKDACCCRANTPLLHHTATCCFLSLLSRYTAMVTSLNGTRKAWPWAATYYYGARTRFPRRHKNILRVALAW